MEPDAPRGSGHGASYDGRYTQSGQGELLPVLWVHAGELNPGRAAPRTRGSSCRPWHRHRCAPEVLLIHVVRSPFPAARN
jgi:hypothetical protein